MIAPETLNEVTRRLVEQFHPRATILFGSQARGTADARSDVDLLIVCDASSSEERKELWLRMDRSLSGLGIGRELVLMTPEEFRKRREQFGNVARYAWKEGRVLHGEAA